MYYRAESLQMLYQLQQSMSLWGIPALHHCYIYILNIDVRVKTSAAGKGKQKTKQQQKELRELTARLTRKPSQVWKCVRTRGHRLEFYKQKVSEQYTRYDRKNMSTARLQKAREDKL